jgi:chemosensory pili system protein ChpA (sensor histidine kinase/response regulator)
MERISKDRSTTANEAERIAIHTIAGTTALEPLGREPEVAKALESFLEAQSESAKPFSDNATWSVASSMSLLETCLAIHEGDPEAKLSADEDQQIEQLLALTVEYEVPEEMREAAARLAAEEPEAEVAPEEDAEVKQEAEAEEIESESASESAEAADTTEQEAEAPEESESEPVDPEILSIFLEEASDILERCDSLLNDWRDDLSELRIVQNLQREIHTFKGGARMAGVTALGQLSHSMETLLERIAGQLLPPSVSAIEVLEQGCDRLSSWTEQAAEGIIPQAGDALKLFVQQVDALNAVPVRPPAAPQKPAQIDTAPEELQEIPDVSVPAPEPEVSKEPSEDAAASQHIRVNADLLDSLVNSAGEISIFRSRLEQQVSDIRENLKEFDVTVARLKEQFRKLEMETETQIRSRYQTEAPDGSGEFDPLELDRFSSIQQLSRSLTESVSDLLNLQELLDKSARQSEALLVQQSRASTELQEGLMQTRMVHFGTIAPRLRRIIRKAAGETRKKARLQLRMTGGGDQLDRNVLERITAPLEHLLRNSIVHGIEKPAARRKLKKPPEGQLKITVAAEATEFVVRVEDDGAGMDLEAIRKRAIDTGLLDKTSEPTEQQLLQFILNSGFTTSKKVTALAGRGVGMDVVNSEIKQIGGSVEIASETGKGTCFTIRIPFTLAVLQAIGVKAGEHRYLIPVASVAGVARMLPDDYAGLLEQKQPAYVFAGESYPILDLESLLGESSTPLGDDTISILMIKSGGQRAAFRVPELLGHREIVIKPVGPQISSVPGILGGSITGDGKVVIIIDVGPLVRQALLTGARPAPLLENIDIRPQKTLALVADDSITMRKVTTRVLESHDFEVVTARDGVEATELMQERVPDLLLLDIEMPRMDGYQVAEHVRADARLRNVPIVMITSRAGKKHRDRGKKAGANAYLSKPYKESELITEVYKLLGKEMKPYG